MLCGEEIGTRSTELEQPLPSNLEDIAGGATLYTLDPETPDFVPQSDYESQSRNSQECYAIKPTIPNDIAVLVHAKDHNIPIAIIADLSWSCFPFLPFDSKCKYAVLGYFRIDQYKVRLGLLLKAWTATQRLLGRR